MYHLPANPMLYVLCVVASLDPLQGVRPPQGSASMKAEETG